MSRVWIRLNYIKRVEVQGRLKAYYPGDWVEVGKQVAKEWIEKGEAWAPVGGYTPKQSRHVNRSIEVCPRLDSLIDWPVEDVKNFAFSIFTVPRHFEGIYAIRQENALNSWVRMKARVEVVLLCDDDGVAEMANLCGFKHVPDVTRNEFGTPLISDVFRAGQEHASNDVVCYVNSDILLIGLDVALKIVADAFDQFLMIGRRWDTDITWRLDFSDGWEERLCRQVKDSGKLHGAGAIDFFAFRKGLYEDVPPFAIGCSAWDNWLVSTVRQRDIPVVNVAPAVVCVHQDMPCLKGPQASKEHLEEKRRNRVFYDRDRGQFSGSLSTATWVLTNESLRSVDGEVILLNDIPNIPTRTWRFGKA